MHTKLKSNEYFQVYGTFLPYNNCNQYGQIHKVKTGSAQVVSQASPFTRGAPSREGAGLRDFSSGSPHNDLVGKTEGWVSRVYPDLFQLTMTTAGLRDFSSGSPHNDLVGKTEGWVSRVYPDLFQLTMTRRVRTRVTQSVTVLSLCVRLCVCVSPVYKAAVLQFEHNCRLYAIIARYSTYRFLLNAFFQKLQPFSAMPSRPVRVRIL